MVKKNRIQYQKKILYSIDFCCTFTPLLYYRILKRYIIYVVLVFVGWQTSFSQEILVQWTGVVRNELLDPIPFASIFVMKDFRGTISDPNGMFTIVTFPRDTLHVSCMGYKTRKIAVPDISYEDSKHYIKDIIMEENVIVLDEIVIFPWRTYKEFKDAFMALELPEDDLIRAYRNIAVLEEQLYNNIARRQASPTANFRDMMASRNSRMMTYGHMYPVYSITNPIAWAQFFQALRNGEFKKRENSSSGKKPSLIEEMNTENTN